MSLAIEFYRVQTESCPYTDSTRSMAVSPNPSDFPYGEDTNCGLVCSPDAGPYSSMRDGAADNIYVIPAPTSMTFGTATLLAAACSLFAILCLISMLGQVLQYNWHRVFGSKDEYDDGCDETVGGTNSADRETMARINSTIGYYLKMTAIPVFGGAGAAILILGEINLFSKQVRYQTEPMASIGQWGPIVGTGMVMVGSLYMLVARARIRGSEEVLDQPVVMFPDGYQMGSPPLSAGLRFENRPPILSDQSSSSFQMSQWKSGEQDRNDESTLPVTVAPEDLDPRNSTGEIATDPSISTFGRPAVRNFLLKMGSFIEMPPEKLIGDDPHRGSIVAHEYPTLPGEEFRNRNLQEKVELFRSTSRARSAAGDSNSSRQRSTSRLGRRHTSREISSSSYLALPGPAYQQVQTHDHSTGTRSRSATLPSGSTSYSGTTPRRGRSPTPRRTVISFETDFADSIPDATDSRDSPKADKGKGKAYGPLLEPPRPIHPASSPAFEEGESSNK